MRTLDENRLLAKDVAAEFLYEKALEGEQLMKEISQMLLDHFRVLAVWDLNSSLWHVLDRGSGGGYGDILRPDDGSDGWASLSELVQWCLRNRCVGEEVTS